MKRILPFFISVSLLMGCEEHVNIRTEAHIVTPSMETSPVASKGDAADDPAIWLNTANPEQSLILGTDKKSGLGIYNLQGELIEFIQRGRLNNVDLRQDFFIGSRISTLAVATNRTAKTLDIFTIDNKGSVTFALAQPLEMNDPYGVCMYLDDAGNPFAFVNSKDGLYQQWALLQNDELAPSLTGAFKLDSQPEGCVVDDSAQTLYMGEESRGVWQMPADAAQAEKMVLIDAVSSGNLVADVEGMDIYHAPEGNKYLVVSSQGDYSYAVYHLNEEHKYLGSFRIVDNPENGIDGAEETDGLAVTPSYLGNDYPMGILVVQDGFNRLPEDAQNFKVISWSHIQRALSLK